MTRSISLEYFFLLFIPRVVSFEVFLIASIMVFLLFALCFLLQSTVLYILELGMLMCLYENAFTNICYFVVVNVLVSDLLLRKDTMTKTKVL